MSRNGSRRGQRRVAVVTGTRAEYGLLKSTLDAIAAHPALSLQLVVTGIHLLQKFGRTLDDIRRDGYRVDATVKMQKGDDLPLDQARGLGRGVAGIAEFLESAATDIVLVLGDRIEAMAGALAAATTNRVLAHIHGGDVAQGDFDDRFRHAITKLAHVHLAATRSARRRIIRMGEESWRVHWVGAPGLDRLIELVRERGRAGRSGRALVVYHPLGRSPAAERKVMTTILGAVKDAGLARTMIYPNTDRGHTGVIEAIEAHGSRHGPEAVRVVRSMERDNYLRALIEADVLVGNSSSGIIEAATAGTPAVDVGDRQRGREASGSSVVHADESLASIRAALRKALCKRPISGRTTVYGAGGAGPKIAAILAAQPLDDAFRRKINAY